MLNDCIMYTDQINNALLKNPATKKIFAGVYPSNHLPPRNLVQKPCCMIINTCNSNITNGSHCHWVSIYIENSQIEYFDTSGRVDSLLFNRHLLRWLSSQNVSVKYNKTPIQSISSKKCGEFCCLYVYCKAVKFDIERFLCLFNKKNLSYNDEIVDKLFKCIFKDKNGKKCVKKKC